MSTIFDPGGSSDLNYTGGECPMGVKRKRFHRVARARQAEGISLTIAAQRLGWSKRRVQLTEAETFDLMISELMQWQVALGVPLENLLFEPEELSGPILERAQLVRLMKTSLTLHKVSESGQAKMLIRHLMEQLTEIMPELRSARAWPIRGDSQHRKLGITAERVFTQPN